MFKVFRSSRGLVDLQSVMAGIIISAITVSFAMVSVVGIVRATAIDQGKTNVRVLQQALDSYYTANDRYPTSIQVLVDSDYLPATFADDINTGKLCYTADTSTSYPQTFTAAGAVESTGDIFYITDDLKTPTLTEGENTACFPAE